MFSLSFFFCVYLGIKNCVHHYIYIEEYIQAVKDAGNIWAVPVIDLNSVCGLYPMMDEYTPYFKDADTDRLHPSDKGHERLAHTLYYQLSALPCVLP